MPDSLYTVSSNEVTIANAGVFSTGDFVANIKTAALAPDGQSILKHTYYNKHPSYILPVSIDTVVSHPISTASNFRTILWKINVK